MINGQTAPIITLWALLYSRDCARYTYRRNRSGARYTGAVLRLLNVHVVKINPISDSLIVLQRFFRVCCGKCKHGNETHDMYYQKAEQQPEKTA